MLDKDHPPSSYPLRQKQPGEWRVFFVGISLIGGLIARWVAVKEKRPKVPTSVTKEQLVNHKATPHWSNFLIDNLL